MATDYSQLLTNPELAGFERQRRMAELLVQRGQKTPQGQMIGNIYVGASPWEFLGNMAQQYVGEKELKDIDQKELSMAKALREKELSDLVKFSELQYGTPDQTVQQAGPMPDGGNIAPQMVQGQEPNPMAAFQLGAQSTNPLVRSQLAEMLKGQKLGEGEVYQRYNPATGKVETVGQGAAKYRAPIQIDTGTAIELRDPLDPTKVISRIGKSQMPTAGQVVETANGPMLIDTRTGAAKPIMSATGEPLAPKLTAEQNKDVTAINQQRAAVNGALELVAATPSAFSFGRGLASKLPAGETLAGRIEKPQETEARSAVFNIVSKVINERAGAAQSAQELNRLNAFLPSELDNAESVKRKLNGFNKYLNEQEKGTRVNPNMPMQPQMTQGGKNFSSEQDVEKAIQSGSLKKGDRVTINGVTGTIQ
jgi:hypothetical protein